jgi:CRP/FNR family transcriptional regulator, cyclic AMP receptor protein
MIGTTRSRVGHFMNKSRELGFIDYNGHLEVHSPKCGFEEAGAPRGADGVRFARQLISPSS